MKVQYLTTSSGRKLAYEYTPGNGPTVVFLGGYNSEMSGTKGSWLAQWCQENERAYLRLDYSGHGQSDGKFADGTISKWFDDALSVIEQVTTGPLVLVGSSMGGWIMLLVAKRIANRIAGMVGIAAAPDFTRDLMWPSFTPAQQRKLQTEGVIYLHSEYDDCDYPVKMQFIEDGDNNLVLADGIDIACPVRLLQGLKDDDVPWQTADRLVEAISSEDLSVTYFKDGDHRLSEPRFLKAITDAIDSVL